MTPSLLIAPLSSPLPSRPSPLFSLLSPSFRGRNPLIISPFPSLCLPPLHPVSRGPGFLTRENFLNLDGCRWKLMHFGQNMTTQHTHSFCCRQFENRHCNILVPVAVFLWRLSAAGRGYTPGHISTYRAHNSKILTTIPMFSGSNGATSRDVDIRQKSKMAIAKWKASSLGFCRYLFSCHVMSWPPSWIWSKRK